MKGLINHVDKLNHVSKKNKLFPRGFKAREIHSKPYIVKIKNIITNDEIKAILSLANGKFNRSEIVVGGEMVYSDTRTSSTAFLTDDGHYGYYDHHIYRFLKRICYIVGCKRSQIESLMCVKYTEGQEFDDHKDYFEHENMYDEEGNRMATFFVYLNTLEPGQGGETEFPLLNVKSRPMKGNAVFWWNMTRKGRLLRKTLHRGNPVKGKNVIKLGLNVWIRQNEWKKY